ncbi:hypothetical protein vBAbaMD22_121 [Acinetobacter phage vB_AbaM_D22]|nr:hypothetical protein vBAbaMD22_121 [Acinetobacter phage vB_AbaM_D22]
MKVYRIEHPETGHGLFRTDWDDIRYHGFLKNLPDHLVSAYHDAFRKIKYYNSMVKHDTPTGESTGKRYNLACAILHGDVDTTGAKVYLTKKEIKIIDNDYKSGVRPLCAAPSLNVMAEWLQLEAIQYMQMCGFKLYEIDLKVTNAIHYVSDTQVVFFPKHIKRKKEICLSVLFNPEVVFE